MGVIHDDHKILPGRHALEAARNIAYARYRFSYLIARRSRVQCDTDGSQQVIDVVFADQSAFNHEASRWRGCPERRTIHRELNFFGLNVGLALHGKAPNRHTARIANMGSSRIVHVDDGPLTSFLSLPQPGE